ncbi:RNA-binding domain-containing protein [Rhizoclosmatium globosum]|uniref:Nuclear cap-binding protein subunit 2 n=1 Tax=Rhizoclosmatium globosum TaxID=329046 RepID=A0A1Y2B791_9FUNG|nr:nuclear cap binding complex subunit [Rhizoclosmatium sp. JEL0117]ORY30712.1 RNA-binding domain-containing protein [Rhizoclosmatium globosum]|eukprot:ORY30712.1 RNA-binding domain-containing protein [Rhizoclosmatium globosum]
MVSSRKSLFPSLAAPSSYFDRKYKGTRQDFFNALAVSSTLYVGNLSFFTTEEQILALFGKVGPVKRIIMGLDRHKRTPCGFCFVEYFHRKDALKCVQFISGTKLDDRAIRTDLDPGFVNDRQYGRGKSGGQVRDEYRKDYDAGRGGWGAQDFSQYEAMQEQRLAKQTETYNSTGAGVPMGARDDFYHANRAPASSNRDNTQSFPSYRSKRRERDDDEEEPQGAGGKRGRDETADDDGYVDEFGRHRPNPRFRPEHDDE